MNPFELVLFGTALFFALVSLLQWRDRRVQNAARLNRGLREYLIEG
jgi:hypothetical protein